MNLFKRKINIPNETKEQIDTVDMWVVSWWSRYGQYYGDVKRSFQSFFTYEDACKLKRSLEDANRLIGNTSDTQVNIEMKSHGL